MGPTHHRVPVVPPDTSSEYNMSVVKSSITLVYKTAASQGNQIKFQPEDGNLHTLESFLRLTWVL